jgi:hypothetical protein
LVRKAGKGREARPGRKARWVLRVLRGRRAKLG